MKRLVISFSLVLILVGTAQAVSIETVLVGNIGNAPDDTGYGAVGYTYNIGKYEVTNAQWREFLNAKAAVGDPYRLYHMNMANTYGGIARAGLGTVENPWVYSAKDGDANWDNRPVNWVNFWDAARFCNWLHNGQGDGDTESGAYLNIGDQTTFARQPGAIWFIPTLDEWYKAAYHKNDGVTGNYWDYPTSSDSSPSNKLINPDPGNNANFDQGSEADPDYTIGSPYYATEVGEFENSESPYRTFDQGGNLREWNETAIGSSRGCRGGNWDYNSNFLRASASYGDADPMFEYYRHGFRVASIPEPGTITLLLFGLVSLFCGRRR